MKTSLSVSWSMLLLGAFALGALGGCASRTQAPVVERATPPAKAPVAASTAKPGEYYTVKKGDTLYSIALEHGQSHRDVAAWNNIDNPALIKIGQQLRVAPPEGVAVSRPVLGPGAVEARPLGGEGAPGGNTDSHKREPKGGKQPYLAQALGQRGDEPRKVPEQTNAARPESSPTEPIAHGADLSWAWPSNGKVIMGFADGNNKGIDIGGRTGDPVVAAEAGKITYAGSAIRGYGNLLIIQHQNGMSSVYAHNSKLLAKEGQMVAKGQKVAEIGSTDTDQPKLHFEIRRQGKPEDPLKLLPNR